ncbi:peptidase [Gautieria morchelliformis]|nr:peptidase [Gautieria morchelliformis]
MKFVALHYCLLPLAFEAFANPITVQELGSQYPLALSGQHPGFSLNLNDRRLVQFEDASQVWMTELEKIEAKARGARFFDITDTRDLGSAAVSRLSTASASPYPAALTANTTVVRTVLKTLSTEGPEANLEKFTSYRTRYYRSDTGRESQQWLLSRIFQITAESASPKLRDSISIKEFPHSWGQASIITRITGTSDSDEVVILGAHLDSTNLIPFLPAPGADDDGSGSVTILEAYRALISAGFQPNKTVEFHWYSAEEPGLLGSQAIAKAYEAAATNVYAMLQLDMTAWVKAGTHPEAGIFTDFVDPGLTNVLKKLVDEYLDIPYVESKCGYACSDHGSWTRAGYRSSFAMESSFENSNGHIHSSQDRIDISPEFSFIHLLEFAKLATAFAIELGGWEKA